MALAKDGGKKSINVVLTEDLHKLVKQEADSKTTNVSALIRMILLERYKPQDGGKR